MQIGKLHGQPNGRRALAKGGEGRQRQDARRTCLGQRPFLPRAEDHPAHLSSIKSAVLLSLCVFLTARHPSATSFRCLNHAARTQLLEPPVEPSVIAAHRLSGTDMLLASAVRMPQVPVIVLRAANTTVIHKNVQARWAAPRTANSVPSRRSTIMTADSRSCDQPRRL